MVDISPTPAKSRGRCCVPFGADTCERVVLGTCLINSAAIEPTARILRPGSFHVTGHRLIFQALLDLYGNRQLVDPVTVAHALRERDQLQEVGGAPYLHLIVSEDGLSDPDNAIGWVLFYARSVASWSLAQSVEPSAYRLVRAAVNGSRQEMAAAFADLHATFVQGGPDAISEPVASDAARAGGTAVALYRWYDADDTLLYVGITGDVAARQSAHAKRSSWAEFAVRSTIERFPCRADAASAEQAAIKADRPLFNHAHNDTADAQRRLVEYLVTHGRTDLLAPAVSRG